MGGSPSPNGWLPDLVSPKDDGDDDDLETASAAPMLSAANDETGFDEDIQFLDESIGYSNRENSESDVETGGWYLSVLLIYAMYNRI